MPLLLTLTSDLDLDDDQVMTQVAGPAGLTIGRGLDNDWIIKDPRRLLSKHHCRLDASGTTFIITDTSTNGVFLNDSSTPIGRGNTAVVGDGDRLRLGELEVVVQAIPDGDAAALAALSADPFAADAGSFGRGAATTPLADDDPWGGWVPPGGDAGEGGGSSGPALRSGGHDGLHLGPPGDAIEAERWAATQGPAGPMPRGDSLFGRAPGEDEGAWGDGTGWDWSDAGAEADNAGPEAMAFTPATAPHDAEASAFDDGDGAASGEGAAMIPDDWEAEAEEFGAEGSADLPLDAGPSPTSVPADMIPEDFDDGADLGEVPAQPPDPIPEPMLEPMPETMSAPMLDADVMMARLDVCLARFAPDALLNSLPSLGDPETMPPAVRQARAWAAYETRYAELVREARRDLAEFLGIDPPAEPE